MDSPKKRYECANCKSILVLDLSTPIETVKCCPEPKLRLFLVEEEGNEREKLNEVFEQIISIIKEYIDMSDQNAKILALWIIGTYFHDSFESFPILFINAMRGSGKTRTLKLIASMAKGGDGGVTNSITEAVLFRHPTNTIMCIDEVESIGNKEKQTLRELLQASYKKGMTVKRLRKVKLLGQEKQVIETFKPYFPIALANIWGIDEVLGDRSITLILEKSDNPRITRMLEDFDTNPTIQNIKRTLERISVVCVVSLSKKMSIGGWNSYLNDYYQYTNNTTTHTTLTTLNNTNDIRKSTTIDIIREDLFKKIIQSDINGRNLELFFPLFVLSDFLNEELLKEVMELSSWVVKGRKEDEYSDSRDVSLYAYVAEHGKEKEFMSIKEMTAHFRLFVGDNDYEEQWVNEKWIGKALKRLCLVIDKKRLNDGRYVILDINKAKEKIKIFKRNEDQK